jgi:AraC family ethanolamine operon transcriptional activator
MADVSDTRVERSSTAACVAGRDREGHQESGVHITQSSIFYYRAQFDDVDEQAASAGSAFTQRYDQISCGGFHGEMARIEVPDAYVLKENANQRMIQVGQTSGIAIFWIWRADWGFRCNGRALDVTTPLILSCGSVYEAVSGPLDDIAMHISEDALRSWCDTVEGFELPNFTGLLPTGVLPATYAARMQRRFGEIFERLEREPALSEQSDWRADLRDLLFHFAASAVAAPCLGCERVGRRERNFLRVVNRARDFIEANKHQRISIEDLSRYAGASRRNLHYAFANLLGVTPSSYLRAVRLNAARRDIKRRAVEGELLADIAARWGFFHLSYFAADYRRHFGELPSETAHIGHQGQLEQHSPAH